MGRCHQRSRSGQRAHLAAPGAMPSQKYSNATLEGERSNVEWRTSGKAFPRDAQTCSVQGLQVSLQEAQPTAAAAMSLGNGLSF